jgi:hypothetical protein
MVMNQFGVKNKVCHYTVLNSHSVTRDVLAHPTTDHQTQPSEGFPQDQDITRPLKICALPTSLQSEEYLSSLRTAMGRMHAPGKGICTSS